MSIELKIKSKHLALEPKIIKHEETKLKLRMKHPKEDAEKLVMKLNGLVSHRKTIVRNEARATHLARGFIAGTAYREMEHKRKCEWVFSCCILPRVVDMVSRYGGKGKVTLEALREWSKVESQND